jgi:hypothetical protein
VAKTSTDQTRSLFAAAEEARVRSTKCTRRSGDLMKLRYAVFLLLILILPGTASAQETENLAASPDADCPRVFTLQKAHPAEDISPLNLAPRVLRDQKRIFLFPFSVARGRHLKPVLGMVGITAALVAVEEHNARSFNAMESLKGFNRVFTGKATSVGMAAVPVAFYAAGLLKKDKYAQNTFWLAGEAVIDTAILTTVMKDIDRRLRPRDVPQNANQSNTWFKYRSRNYLTGVGSFPSGHTIAAFSIATTYAKRYPNPRWRAWLAYGLASVVGFSRVSQQSHFPSDVFVAASLGYVITNCVVLKK